MKEEPVGREIKDEIYERSREFLSDEPKLEWVDGKERHVGDRIRVGEGELRYSTATFWGSFQPVMEVRYRNYFPDWNLTSVLSFI